MNEFKLSYCITTYNKFPYLKEVMRLLLQNVQPDEEIVIADGGSTDGTKEYLQKLFEEGAIHQFISEKDKGEAHGYNKTFLMARGVLLKVITDDDVFYYPAIRESRKFMEAQLNVDALVGNNGTAISSVLELPFLNPEMQMEFEKWVKGLNETFYCNCLPLMVRKSALSFLGLFNTQYVAVDLEYTIRTGRIANYAFATQFTVTRIINPGSNGEKFTERCHKEQIKLCEIYNYPIPATWKGEALNKMKRSAWWKFKNYFNSKIKSYSSYSSKINLKSKGKTLPLRENLNELFSYHLRELEILNQGIKPTFLTKFIQ